MTVSAVCVFVGDSSVTVSAVCVFVGDSSVTVSAVCVFVGDSSVTVPAVCVFVGDSSVTVPAVCVFVGDSSVTVPAVCVFVGDSSVTVSAVCVFVGDSSVTVPAVCVFVGDSSVTVPAVCVFVGDSSVTASAVCATRSLTAQGSSASGLESGSDYQTRPANNDHRVVFAPGVTRATCNVRVSAYAIMIIMYRKSSIRSRTSFISRTPTSNKLSNFSAILGLRKNSFIRRTQLVTIALIWFLVGKNP